MKYSYEIVETLSKVVSIDASTEDEAYKKLKEMYRNSEVILDADNYVATEIELLQDNVSD